MSTAHEGHFLGRRACQMALYVKVSSGGAALISLGHFIVTVWTLTPVFPLSEQPTVSLTVPDQLMIDALKENNTVAYTLFISLLLICCYLATKDDCIWLSVVVFFSNF